jgi:phospholipase C
MAIEVSRRQLMASAGGIVLASFALPSNLRRVLESAPASLLGSQRPGVRGFGDPTVSKSVFYQPDPSNPDNYLLPFHTDTHSSSAQALPSNSHSWGPLHQSWNDGQMNGFVTAHIEADGVAGQYTMAYFQRDDLPFHWALADAFTVCDGYHCSMLGPT